MAELLDVVDEDDKVIGKATYSECKSDPRKIVRVVHVFIFNRKGDMLLQKRTRNVGSYPELWTSAVSGHVRAGEGYTKAALRELREELGIRTALKFMGKLNKRIRNDNQNMALFAGFHDGPFRPNRHEIQKVAFFPRDAVARKIRSDKAMFTPGFLIAFKAFFSK
ncbi:MAG: NUDIX domain-containing protein [Candidatus Aenigmarchaeota archaeon]|nr:NUDIX domain-containing protein [Candidatus Aenigmarchaeota archaeon]